MPVSSRGLLTSVYLIGFGLFAVCASRPTPQMRAADPPRDSPGVTVYDPDTKHLWNRLHEALCVRLDGEGSAHPGDSGLSLWQQSPYSEKGEQYKRVLAVLDEFLAERGDRLITDPRKRALL